MNSTSPGKSRRGHSSDDMNSNEGKANHQGGTRRGHGDAANEVRGENDEDPENAVVGMGDHMPDFLKKPARPQ